MNKKKKNIRLITYNFLINKEKNNSIYLKINTIINNKIIIIK